MKIKVVSGIMLTLLFLGMLTLAFNIQPVEAGISPYSPAGGIKLSPPSVNYISDKYCTYNNTKFDVAVIIWNITGCVGYYFVIHYNSTLITLDSWTFDTDPANPLSPTQMAPAPADRVDTDVSVLGSVKLSNAWKAGVPSYSYAGDSVAARLTFKIIHCPPQFIGGDNTVSTTLAFDRTWTKAFDSNADEILFATFNDGYYEYTTTDLFGPHILAVYSSPPGVTFIVDSVPHTTPWSEWYPYGSTVSVVMPETHDGYVWDRWSDGDTNITKTCTTFSHVDLTALYQNPPAVGGIYIPVDKLSLLAPYIGLTTLLAVAVVTVVYVKKRKRKTEINS